jgi:Mn2+/Fe2+ NRAMP family transporter
MRRASGAAALLAVVGPGLLAGLSDDDAPGVTTYSVLGAEYGYELLWVLLLSTVALIVFHEIGSRVGLVTGQGMVGLIRERHGVRVAGAALVVLVVANAGTTCAEFAGVAAAGDLAGIPRVISVPVAAALVSGLVLFGGFHRVERVLMALATLFAAYIISGILAGPDWAAAARGLVVPTLPADREAVLITTATVGTTLAPWGLAFIQSYAVDKRLSPDDLRYERIDVVVGAVMTGVIGFFIVIACAATLHADGRTIEQADDAAAALEPLAGSLASLLFGAGLLGASLLAASVLPLSTAYSVSEAIGSEGALDDSFADARPFYLTYGALVAVGAGVVMIPGAPLIDILFLTQALNAVLLLPLIVLIGRIAGDRDVMGVHANGPLARVAVVIVIAMIAVCVAALAVLSVA